MINLYGLGASPEIQSAVSGFDPTTATYFEDFFSLAGIWANNLTAGDGFIRLKSNVDVPRTIGICEMYVGAGKSLSLWPGAEDTYQLLGSTPDQPFRMDVVARTIQAPPINGVDYSITIGIQQPWGGPAVSGTFFSCSHANNGNGNWWAYASPNFADTGVASGFATRQFTIDYIAPGGVGEWKFYIDGVLVATLPEGTNNPGTPIIYCGSVTAPVGLNVDYISLQYNIDRKGPFPP